MIATKAQWLKEWFLFFKFLEHEAIRSAINLPGLDVCPSPVIPSILPRLGRRFKLFLVNLQGYKCIDVLTEFNVVCKGEAISLMCVECSGVYLKEKTTDKLITQETFATCRLKTSKLYQFV